MESVRVSGGDSAGRWEKHDCGGFPTQGFYGRVIKDVLEIFWGDGIELFFSSSLVATMGFVEWLRRRMRAWSWQK